MLFRSADGIAHDSFHLGEYPVSTSIGALRNDLQSRIPSNPAPTQQRLLYLGRALVDDAQTLADALNTKRDASQTEYVIHLLVKTEGVNSAPHTHRQHMDENRSGQQQ